MSTTIDSNVVEMRFENGQFEQGVSQSMSSIEKLKQSLNFDNASAAAAQGVSVVVQGFDMLNYALANIVSNLANNAWAKLISVVKSLSVDNIAAGWSKYTTLMDGVQVIMSATRDQWEDQNAQMDSGHMHTLYNMALVDKDTNAALSNNLIDVKRRILQSREEEGKTYVPIATNYVFNKHFSNQISDMKFWNKDDREAYFAKIEEAYHYFINKKNSYI